MPKIAMQVGRSSLIPGSQPGVDRRFTERDIRLHPELREAAYTYVRNYRGSFEPVLAAQELLHETSHLPDPITKMVLNTAYSDPSVRFSVTEDDDGGYDEFFEESNVVEFPFQPAAAQTRIRTPEPEEPPVRRRSLRLRAKVKAPYGMSSWNGKVLHRVSRFDSYMEWPFERERELWETRREPTWRDKRGEPYLMVRWECGVRPTSNPALFTERPDDVPYCRGGCFSRVCERCEKSVHLDPRSGPEDPIGPCPRCKE